MQVLQRLPSPSPAKRSAGGRQTPPRDLPSPYGKETRTADDRIQIPKQCDPTLSFGKETAYLSVPSPHGKGMGTDDDRIQTPKQRDPILRIARNPRIYPQILMTREDLGMRNVVGLVCRLGCVVEPFASGNWPVTFCWTLTI
jgi:hypothetical protein